MMPVHPDWAGPGRGWPRRCGQDDGDADRHPLARREHHPHLWATKAGRRLR